MPRLTPVSYTHLDVYKRQGLKPDLVIFLDIDPEKALKRKLSIDGGDRLENEDISFPVSYTHLDVYKRQIKSNAKRRIEGAGSIGEYQRRRI